MAPRCISETLDYFDKYKSFLLLLPADPVKLWQRGLLSFLPRASAALTHWHAPEYAILSLYYLCCC